MAKNEYIVAIEIGSSKISGAIGIHTTAGIRILAYANEPSNTYVSKGVIRNVDEASNSLNSLINRLESQLEDVHIKKAYISFSCMSIHSVSSKITKKFDSYTKITQDIINEMFAENEQTFIIPKGYKKLQVVPQEYKLEGDSTTSPIGIPTQSITCNYLNIIVKEQYIQQQKESFEAAKTDIVDSFNTACLEAEYILNEEELNCGAAIVSIGAETTTVAVYSGKVLRKLIVIPLGSANITKDICNEQINTPEAEKIKIFKGYGSSADKDCPLQPEKIDNIISGRMSEILKNTQYQIENSGYNIGRIVFTGGGSKLINLSKIIEENIPNYKYRIASDIQPPYNKDNADFITTGSITPALFVLLSNGNTNCCEEEVLAPANAAVATDIFDSNTNTQETGKSPKDDNPNGEQKSGDEKKSTETTTVETTKEIATTKSQETETETAEDKKTNTQETKENNKNTDKKSKGSYVNKVMGFFEDWFNGEVISDESDNKNEEKSL